MATSARHLFDQLVAVLLPVYESAEARSIAFLLLKSKLGITKTAVLTDQKTEPVPSDLMANWITRLQNHEPVQYIIGETEFYGRMFFVNPDVLIPRPETEELVAWVLENNRIKKSKTCRILDIGTGSGCIAVSLALEIPAAEVWAMDISAGALSVAGQNAQRQGAGVHFRQTDFLNGPFPADLPTRFDIVVSNPPYITRREQALMHANVLEHEPHTALFVTDHDPLVFYRHIARYCRQCLCPDGQYYVETNENLAAETAQLIQSSGLTAHIRHDLFGKPRMISGYPVKA